MYEVLEDGRVALDPTAPNDRVALSVYADLLRRDEELMGGAGTSLNELDVVFRTTREEGVYYVVKDSVNNDLFLEWLKRNPQYEIIKVVIKDLTQVDESSKISEEDNEEKEVV